MSVSIHAIAIPTFVTGLEALDAILAKAIDYCDAKKIDSAVMCQTRLIPNMLPLWRQVTIACDHAKNGPSRIAGVEPPRFEDNETTLQELRERVAKTVAYVKTIDEAALNAAPGRMIEFKVGPNAARMEAAHYLLHFVLPNFYFHLTTAYDILRTAGVDIGKRDFMGNVPGYMAV
jgi:hypothetical protein